MLKQKKEGIPVFDGTNIEAILSANGWTHNHATTLYGNDGPYPQVPLQETALDPYGIQSEGYPRWLSGITGYLEDALLKIPLAGGKLAKVLKSPTAKNAGLAASVILIVYGLANSGGPVATAEAQDTSSSYHTHIIPLEAYKDPSEIQALTVNTEKVTTNVNGIHTSTIGDNVLDSANNYKNLALIPAGLEDPSTHSDLNLSAEYQQELNEHKLPSGMVILSNDQKAIYHIIDSFTIGIENAKNAIVIYNGHVLYRGDVTNTAFVLKADGVHTQEIEKYGTDYKSNSAVFTPGQPHKGSILVNFEEANSNARIDYINGKQAVFFGNNIAPLKENDVRNGCLLLNERILGEPLNETLDDITALYGNNDLGTFMPKFFP